MSKREIHLKVTGDGSHTLFVPELNENYHSWHGAYTESLHVFIAMGLQPAAEKYTPVNILEIGFGTGLNAVLAYQFCEEQQHEGTYTGLEKFPLDLELVSQLNYKEMWKDAKLDAAFDAMHHDAWNSKHQMGPYFEFEKNDTSALEYSYPSNYFHLIFFDAFAPEKQPDIWTPALFVNLYNSLQSGGMLVTYCAKGQFKRDLRAAGFEVQTLQGPPGKREMVRGVKQ